jgi:hypothetical protein
VIDDDHPKPLPTDWTSERIAAERAAVAHRITAAVVRGLAPVLVRLTNERLTAEEVKKEEAA